MKQRIITSVIAVLVLLPVLIFADSPILPFGVAVCSLLAVYEMLHCVGLHKSVAVSIPMYLAAAVFPFLLRFADELSLDRSMLLRIALCAAVLVVLYLFTVVIFSHGKYQIQPVAVAFMSLLYILIGFNGIIVVHDFCHGGEYLYLTVFIAAWTTDIFAYFCGILFGRGGKHKLIPDVSPKKTVEGAVGGIVFCVLAMLLFGFIVDRMEPELNARLWVFALAGLAASVVAQIGDLSMSVIKRTYGIKDYGRIFPGHGGMLDRFDSVLAVSVILWVITAFLPFFQGV